MPEPVARQRLREARERAVAEREAGETQRPSMYAAAVEAAAGALPDVPAATVEQVALAVLRVALPLHETQHADAWKAAHERAVHFELESVKANERAERAEKEVQRCRGLDAVVKELLARNVELGTRADNAKAKCEDLEDEVGRLRALTGKEEVSWAVYTGHDAEDGDMYHSTAEEYARDAAVKGIPVTKWVTRVYPTAVYNMELDESGEWREVPDA